jgi:hypothetical protein
MKIYIDSDFKCHTNNADVTFREVESDFFNSKCDSFIEGYRYIPMGESWIREDGVTFHGEMITPWKDYFELDEAQREHEIQLIAEYIEALKIMGVTV